MYDQECWQATWRGHGSVFANPEKNAKGEEQKGNGQYNHEHASSSVADNHNRILDAGIRSCVLENRATTTSSFVANQCAGNASKNTGRIQIPPDKSREQSSDV